MNDKVLAEKTMYDTNPYKAYAEETILNASPIGLVVALYEGAIEACTLARKFLADGDIPARTKSINKANDILAELLRSLNDEKGGDVTANLRRLYIYLQRRVIEAHARKDDSALAEVVKLLTIGLEGWRLAAAKVDALPHNHPAFFELAAEVSTSAYSHQSSADTNPYGHYMPEWNDPKAPSAYSF